MQAWGGWQSGLIGLATSWSEHADVPGGQIVATAVSACLDGFELVRRGE
jgi:hypothetical protein